MGFPERDYSKEFSITLEWHEWNRLGSLVFQGMQEEEEKGMPPDVIDKNREAHRRLVDKINENSPGNGMKDWPDSMKEAHGEAVRSILEDLREDK